MKTVWRLGAVLLPLLLTACGEQKPATPKAEVPLRVSVITVGQVAAAPYIEAAGTTALRKEIPLGFTSPGRIARVYVQEGDRVRAGQVLAVLDTTTVSAGVETAAAERDRARAELRRIKTLFDQGWVTRARLESAEAAARTAEANVTSRRFALETARVLAPSSGIILARSAEPAQIVDAGTPIVTLGDSGSGFVLRALLSDRDAVRVRPGITAEVVFEALPGPALAGRVIEIGGRSDRGSGAFTIEIALPPDSRLRSGLVGRVRLDAPAAGGSTRLIIPPTAIFAARAEEGFVYVVGPDSRLRLRRVALGRLSAAGSEVLSGLATGETIVTSGLDRLREGARIEPVRTAP